MTSRHVLVLSGGLSPERDVSLRSGRRVADALRDVRPDWHVAEADVDAALLPYLQQNRPDCIVPLLHGAAGEDGALRDLLETLDIDYVGSDASGSRLAFDKPVASTLVSGTGVAVPEFVVMPQSTFRELGAPAVMAAIGDRIGFPLVVKPTRGGSALGVSIVRHSEDLPHAMVSAFAYGETVMIQRFISGTEVAVSVIDSPDGVRLLSRFPNLIVCRTFSKAWGLAALRVGYSLSSPDIADILNRVRQPFNVDSVALAAATAVLADEAYLERSREVNAAGLKQLAEGFDRMGLKYIPSAGNFIAVENRIPIHIGVIGIQRWVMAQLSQIIVIIVIIAIITHQ